MIRSILDPMKVPEGVKQWVGERASGPLSSNVQSKGLPFQAWRPFKEAFAPEIVVRAITETEGRVSRVLDPFGGSGTTALASQLAGCYGTTIEVNPFLADLIEAKLSSYDIEMLTRSYAGVMRSVREKKSVRRRAFAHLPPTFVEPGVKERYLFPRKVADHLVRLLDGIEACEDLKSRRLFRVLMAAVALEASNVVISGKGRRYRRQWQSREVTPEMISAHFSRNVLAAIDDICHHGHRAEPSYQLMRGDSRTLLKMVGEQDVAVFSPPYPNSFDYTDVYNVELWLLGYLRGAVSNRKLRGETLRSHVQILRNYDHPTVRSVLLDRVYEQLCELRQELWSRSIPEMIVAYFADMQDVMRSVAGKLRPGGRIYCVVGDSQYAGVVVPVASILEEFSEACGLQFSYTEQFRSMRASPQQGGRHQLPESLLVFEKP